MKIKLKAAATPYSTIVGGGVMLSSVDGPALFQIAIMGVSQGVTKQESDEIAAWLTKTINGFWSREPDDLEVTAREDQSRTNRDM